MEVKLLDISLNKLDTAIFLRDPRSAQPSLRDFNPNDLSSWGSQGQKREAPLTALDLQGYPFGIASAAGLVAPALWIPYSTSKFAVVGFSRGCAQPSAPRGSACRWSAPCGSRRTSSRDPPPKLAGLQTPRSDTSRPSPCASMGVGCMHLPGRQMSVEVAARRIFAV